MPKANKNILLLIEDNPLLIGLYKSAFENRGFKIIMAHDGETGIRLAQSELPDLILLDLLMPGMHGLEVLRKLRSNENTKKIKVVILTIVSDKKEREKAMHLGADDYIIKQDMELDQIVERVVKNCGD